MRNFFLSFLIIFSFGACNDGDVIVTTFDFESIELNVCGDVGDYVFFKVNNTNLETLSLQLSTQDSILTQENTLTYNIDASTNVVNYRTFKDEIPASYFCSSIPPTEPKIVLDYKSSEGIATVFTRITDTLITGIGLEQDTSFVYTTTIVLNNLRLESENESITQETLELGSLNTTAQ
ncbi:MAG: hypothetical protein NXH73_09575 [Flavobacteriaceae bacterium]|nr:hypothetical protein [Flavobacteriaceae bacterium]